MTQADHSPRAIIKPLVGISMGDPAGIGPEIIVKALSDPDILKTCTPLVLGDQSALRQAAEISGLEFDFGMLGNSDLGRVIAPGGKYIFDMSNVPAGMPLGVESTDAGAASGEYIRKAVDLCLSGVIDAVATAPINKKSFSSAGYEYPGHTEFLADLTVTKEFAMCFFAEKLRVVLLSTHLRISEAILLVKKEALVKLIRFTARELEKLLGKAVKIAVAGLNPHASEGGMFGDEEAKEIAPAIRKCRDELEIDVSGPYSPDTVFLRGFQGEFDAVIACYHDQATIPVKCLSFGKAVNVTLGLPIIRTSVDHGTAFEIAGQNKAESGSMKEAILLAAELSALRRHTA